jgi:hypothetical protein
MGTKLNPGKFDCYENAEPDEPLFTLLARDPLAPGLVQIWAMLRAGAYTQARGAFNKLVDEAHLRSRKERVEDEEKITEATRCAYAMEAWWLLNRRNAP